MRYSYEDKGRLNWTDLSMEVTPYTRIIRGEMVVSGGGVEQPLKSG